MFSQNKNGETYHTYGYTNAGWSDLLTSFDGGTITYDTIGNPLTYHDGKTFTWTAGRKLSTVTDGDSNYTYAYDGDGNRISKTAYGETTDYYYIDGKLLGLKKGQDTLLFLYDETGTAYGFLHNGTPYYYDINLQGDVVGIYNGSGNLVASYTYDVWGAPELTSDNAIATLNPLRYRGYFYDEETGFYYVSSRYYDPEVGRFINADGLVSTGQGILGNNMFAYCLNNPVNYEDSDGEMAAAAGALAWGVAAGGANAWNPAGWIILGATAIAAIGILVIPWDSVGQSISNGWNKVKSSARSASISRSISKAVSKAKTKIRNEKRRYDYWIAAYVEYDDGRGAYIPTTPLSYTRAISYVRGGGSVFADSRNNAYKLAKAVGGGTPARDPAHGGLGYWRHYHATRGGRRIGGHVFYVA